MAENNNFNKKNKNLNSLLAGFDEKPPVSSSVPIKDFQMRIARDGIWYYQESPINRMRLVKLFASVLQKENDGTYWLITPVEKGLIDVDDAPFLAVEVERKHENELGAGDTCFVFRTNLDEFVVCSADNPLRVFIDPETEQPNPYILVRNGLEAKITRAVFYELVDLADEHVADGKRVLGIWSKGTFFQLGPIDSD
jgi:hypothetical protein